jgi:hypothetical protein
MVRVKTAKDLLALLAELEETASKIGVSIRYEKLAQGPVRVTHGSCRVREQDLIIIDSRIGPGEKLEALAEELSRFDLEEVFVSPAARSLMEKRR